MQHLGKLTKMILGVLLVCIVFAGFLWLNNDIGVQKSRLEADIRSSQKIKPDWTVDGTVSDTVAAFISYPGDRTDHTFSVYVNRPGLSFGYFFRSGGSLGEVETGIAEFTLEGYQEKAFISMNQQQVDVSKLSERLITDPDSLDIHDVTIAMSKARMSLNLAQTVIDRLVTGWNEISNSR